MGSGLKDPAEEGLALAEIVRALRTGRESWRRAQGGPETGGRALPSRDALLVILKRLGAAMFPMHLGPADLRQESEDYYVGHALAEALNALHAEVRLELEGQARQGQAPAGDLEGRARSIVRDFGASLASIRELLESDVLAAYQGDPTARSADEVLLSYPGLRAITHHRIAHRLYELGTPILARLVAEIAHDQTGIDIHPGASIGPGFFIDHGTGVVIGESAVIGRNVRLYQAVTLGAPSFEADTGGAGSRRGARHPVLEDDVVVYAGASILGPVTIGRGSIIGGNVWLTQSVPANSRITQASARHETFVEGAGI